MFYRSNAPTTELLESLRRAGSKFNNNITTATIENCIGDLLKPGRPEVNKVGTRNFGKTQNSGY